MGPTASAGDFFPSRRLLVILRLVIGCACVVSVLFPGGRPNGGVVLLSLAFAGYALAGAVTRLESRPGFDLLGVLFQTMFFLVYAASGGRLSGFLAPAVYAHLVLSTVILLRVWDTVVVTVACAGFLAIVRTGQAVILLPVVIWVGVLGVISAIRRAQLSAMVEQQVQQGRQYRVQAEQARNEIRQKLAGDFHDGPLQAFSSLQMRLEALRKILERRPAAAAEEVRSLQEFARTQTAEMRSFLRGIRPVEVGEAGLVSSLRQVVTEFERHSGVATTLQGSRAQPEISEERSQELIQVVTEALTNVRKHAKATRAAVTVKDGPHQLEISVEDNGSGFPFSGAYTLEELESLRLGPLSIRKRVRSLGGKMVIESRPQRGASLTVQIPV